MPTALITGITGQDGFYLAEHLLSQGYEVYGLIRGQNNPKRHVVEAHAARRRDRARRPARPDVPHQRRPEGPARRDLQPRRHQLRPALLEPAGAHRRDHRPRRPPHARSDPHRHRRHRPRAAAAPHGIKFYQASSSEMFGKVTRDAPERGDAVPPAQSLRRREGLRPLHHRQLPRELRHLRLQRHPLQPRVAATRAGVRDAQDHARAPCASSSASRTSSCSATSTPSATGATPATTSAPCT